MGTERSDVLAIRPREQAALRTRVARAGGHIIRVEEVSEALVEHAIAGETRRQQELLQEPCRMRAVPFGRAGIGHRLHHLILRCEQRGAAFGFRSDRAEGITPDGAWIGRCSGLGCEAIAFVAQATKDRRRGRGRHAQSRGWRNRNGSVTGNCLGLSIVPHYTGRGTIGLRLAHILHGVRAPSADAGNSQRFYRFSPYRRLAVAAQPGTWMHRITCPEHRATRDKARRYAAP